MTALGQPPPGAARLADPVHADPVLANPVLADPVQADPVLAERATSLLTGITQRIGQVLARVTDIGAAAESIAAATQAAGPPLRRDDFSPLQLGFGGGATAGASSRPGRGRGHRARARDAG